MRNLWISKLKLWLIDDGEQHWYSAESKNEALEIHLKLFISNFSSLSEIDDDELEMEIGCRLSEIDIERVNDAKMLSVDTHDHGMIEKSAKEWAADGKGCVASTVY